MGRYIYECIRCFKRLDYGSFYDGLWTTSDDDDDDGDGVSNAVYQVHPNAKASCPLLLLLLSIAVGLWREEPAFPQPVHQMKCGYVRGGREIEIVL